MANGIDTNDPAVRALLGQILLANDQGNETIAGAIGGLGSAALAGGAFQNLQQGGSSGLMGAISGIPGALGIGSSPGPQPPTSPGGMSGSPTPVGQLGGMASGAAAGNDNSGLIRSLLMSRIGGMG